MKRPTLEDAPSIAAGDGVLSGKLVLIHPVVHLPLRDRHGTVPTT